MNHITLKKICDNPESIPASALWFAEKWDLPCSLYEESMEECIKNKSPVPQWYVAVNDENEIIAGAGIIENDFHDRKDLKPNLCALFVEEAYRGKNIASDILNFARRDFGSKGFEKLYLVTDHTEFYERCGWDFVTFVHDEEGNAERLYEASTFR